MKIAVYTGTFNPLHIGHLSIIRYMTESGLSDMVYLIVSPQSPFKGFMKAETGAERYRAAVQALSRHPELKAKADDIELHMPAPQYTIRTLDALKAREPENDFTLVIGGDNLPDIDKWKDWKRILTEYGVAVYPRKGHDMSAAKARLENECPGSRILLMTGAPVVDISSTEIREGLAAGHDMSGYLM